MSFVFADWEKLSVSDVVVMWFCLVVRLVIYLGGQTYVWLPPVWFPYFRLACDGSSLQTFLHYASV